MTADNTVTKGFVLVGGVVKPHGIRGEFCIKSYADSPSLFDTVPAIYLQDGKNRPEPFEIRSWRVHKGMILCTLKGVDDRDRAETLRGRSVLVREADLPPLEDGEAYLYQMEGCRVVLEDGTPIGVLVGFYDTPGQETMVIHDDRKREILLPAVAEFVLDVNLDAETITVRPPEGLLDLYLAPAKTSPKKKRPARQPKASS